MRYWIWWNDLIQGPFELEELTSLKAFSEDLPVCMEDRQEWIPAGRVADMSSAIEQLRERLAAPLTPPPPPPKRAPSLTPLQGEFFADAPGQQQLIEPEEGPKGPFAFRSLDAQTEMLWDSRFQGYATNPFHFMRQPATSAIAVVEPPIEAPKQTPLRHIPLPPPPKRVEKPPISLRVVEPMPAPPAPPTTPILPIEEKLAPSRAPSFDFDSAPGEKPQWLIWALGAAIVIAAMSGAGLWIAHRPAPATPIVLKEPSVPAEPIKTTLPEVPVTPLGSLPTSPSNNPGGYDETAPPPVPLSAKEMAAANRAPAVNSVAPAAAPASVPTTTAVNNFLPEMASYLKDTASGAMNTLKNGAKLLMGRFATLAAKPPAVAPASPFNGAPVAASKSVVAQKVLDYAAAKSQEVSPEAEAAAERRAAAIANGTAIATSAEPEELEPPKPKRVTAKPKAKISHAPAAKKVAEVPAEVVEEAPATVEATPPISLDSVAPAGPAHAPQAPGLKSESDTNKLGPDSSPLKTDESPVTPPPNPWKGKQAEAIALVLQKTLPRSKITIGSQAKALLQQMHEKELIHAAETGERLFLPDKLAWTALQEDGAMYRVYLNFLAWQISGERVQTHSYQFIVDLKQKTVRTEDASTTQDLLTQPAELTFKHNPMATDIDSILGGVDTYNKHKVQMMIFGKNKRNKDERVKVEAALNAAKAKVRRAVVYFRRTYTETALANVAKAYQFEDMLKG